MKKNNLYLKITKNNNKTAIKSEKFKYFFPKPKTYSKKNSLYFYFVFK